MHRFASELWAARYLNIPGLVRRTLEYINIGWVHDEMNLYREDRPAPAIKNSSQIFYPTYCIRGTLKKRDVICLRGASIDGRSMSRFGRPHLTNHSRNLTFHSFYICPSFVPCFENYAPRLRRVAITRVARVLDGFLSRTRRVHYDNMLFPWDFLETGMSHCLMLCLD